MEQNQDKCIKSHCGHCTGIAIMAGLIVLGCCITAGLKSFKVSDCYVSVKGLCEREVKADKAIYPIRYLILANEIQEVYSQSQAKNSTIIGYLKKHGISEDEITVAAPSITDTRTEYGERKPYNYTVKNIITVCTDKVDIVRELVSKQGELMNLGIVAASNEWDTKVQYFFNGLNDIKPEMIAEATANARVAAEQFAKDSKSKLGHIRRASQGQFSISDRDENTPYIKVVRVVTNVDYLLKH